MSAEAHFYGDVLPAGIRSRLLPNGNGLLMHVLEAGYARKGAPCLLLLHGFPELAYSWRKLMLPLAAAGFYVVAPDQRGYGRTTGWHGGYDDDLSPFRVINLVRDTLGLCVLPGQLDQVGFQLHADGACTELACRIDGYPAIARAQVDDQIVPCGVRHLQHAMDHAFGRRHPDRVLADLAELRGLSERAGRG